MQMTAASNRGCRFAAQRAQCLITEEFLPHTCVRVDIADDRFHTRQEGRTCH